MKKRTRFLQTGLITLGLSLPLPAVELTDALQQSVKSNPTIQERLKNYNTVVEDLSYAYGAYLPTVDVRLGLGHEYTKSNFTKGSVASLDAQDYSAHLKYNLFNGFGDMYAISQQEYRLKSAAYSYVENVDDTLLDLVEAYINVLRHKELMEVERDNIKMDEKIYTGMIEKQKKGHPVYRI